MKNNTVKPLKLMKHIDYYYMKFFQKDLFLTINK